MSWKDRIHIRLFYAASTYSVKQLHTHLYMLCTKTCMLCRSMCGCTCIMYSHSLMPRLQIYILTITHMYTNNNIFQSYLNRDLNLQLCENLADVPETALCYIHVLFKTFPIK